MGEQDTTTGLADALGRFVTADTPADAVLDAMVAFAYSDGLASVAELHYIGMLRFGGDAPRAFAAISASTRRLCNDVDLDAAISRIAAMVTTDAQREEVLAHAVAVTYADLEINRREDRAIAALYRALGLSLARAHEICETVADAIERHDPMAKLPADLPLPASFTDGRAWPGFRSP